MLIVSSFINPLTFLSIYPMQLNYFFLVLCLIGCFWNANAAPQSISSRIDGTLSEALEGLKAHKKVNPNPPPPPAPEKAKRQNRPIPKPTTKTRK